MFSGFSKLSSLSDISKWNTINVIDMKKMLYECSKLSSLPIFKMNTKNAMQ